MARLLADLADLAVAPVILACPPEATQTLPTGTRSTIARTKRAAGGDA
jgi:hypothetical protein